VLLLGSKKHILARMFSGSDRPFAGWGRDRTHGTDRGERQGASRPPSSHSRAH
jgi:hypothetical protein